MITTEYRLSGRKHMGQARDTLFKFAAIIFSLVSFHFPHHIFPHDNHQSVLDSQVFNASTLESMNSGQKTILDQPGVDFNQLHY